VLAIVREDAVCRRLITVPGVGPVVAVTFKSAVDDPSRIAKSKAVGALFGLTPRKYQAVQRGHRPTATAGFRSPKSAKLCAPAIWTWADARSRLAETEFAVRGRGYVKGLSDLEQIVVKDERGVPVLLKDVARIELTPDERRGITEMNGEGEVVSGIALQRFGENALSVIRNVKDRLAEIAPSLPQGVSIESVYDRSDLIYRAIETLRRTLIEESAIVALVCVVFLLHVRSALVAVITLPIGVLIAYLCMYVLGLSSNVMSLGGIAIAIGAMVDAAIVMIENAHKHLERAPADRPRAHIIVNAASEVGPALFFSLLVITVSFLPIFALEAQEGHLFKPLAYTKTFAMAAAALLSATLVPALMILFVRGRIIPEHKNPVNRFLIGVYRPAIRVALRFKAATILAAMAILAASLWPAMKLGSEFMPNLNEGTLF
jgi:Cu(I)/Ag(I) efflux system membrane protein CusA/SilA